MARIFVMPRVVDQPQFGGRGAREPKPVQAHKLLTGRKPHRRLVILGGPGTGKTTLLEGLCLALAQAAAEGANQGIAQGARPRFPGRAASRGCSPSSIVSGIWRAISK